MFFSEQAIFYNRYDMKSQFMRGCYSPQKVVDLDSNKKSRFLSLQIFHIRMSPTSWNLQIWFWPREIIIHLEGSNETESKDEIRQKLISQLQV